MSRPTIHGKHRTVSASSMLEALGEALTAIKVDDKATYSDLGAVLGKSEDQAAKYADGTADMGVVSFLRGCRVWDGRFANEALALVGMKLVPLDVGNADHHAGVTTLMKAVLSLHEALENDDRIDDDELHQRRLLIEDAGKVIDRLRERLTLRAVAS